MTNRVVTRTRAALGPLNRIGGFAILAAVLAFFILHGLSVSVWLQMGTIVAGGALGWSLRHLRDEEQGDHAMVVALLAVAVLGAVLFVTISSLHSWRWIPGLIGTLAIFLVPKGFVWLVDWLDRPPRVGAPTDANDATPDVWQKLTRYRAR